MINTKTNPPGTIDSASLRDSDENSRLDALMNRIHQLTVAQTQSPKRPSEPAPDPVAVSPAGPGQKINGEWMPIEPDTLTAAGLSDSDVEALILKTLNGRAEATGRSMSDHIKFPLSLIHISEPTRH